ncbi:glycosyltransferase family 2 protein [Candidatus Bathyarchaeota archaeon]|nr:glycosyltransferase family 2 protein [Candidatus Bathyarchaeota archaeon]
MISVIVLSKNNGDTLDACLSSIINSYGDKEIIVVDAHSIDNTPAILEKYRGKIKVVYDDGKGIGIARNIGVMHSKGDIICFVDADAFCSKDHFIKIKDFFDRHPDIGIINVKVKEKMTVHLPYVQRMEAKIRFIRGKSKYTFGKSEALLATGYFMSFRRKVFDDVKGFWEFPPFGADDSDFTMKALLKGWKKGIISLTSWHRHRTSLIMLLKEMWGWGRGYACFIWKWRKNPLTKKRYKRSFLSKLVRDDPLLLTIASYIFSPVIALRYVIEGKSMSLYPYYVVRQCAYFFGFLWGLTTWAKILTRSL